MNEFCRVAAATRQNKRVEIYIYIYILTGDYYFAANGTCDIMQTERLCFVKWSEAFKNDNCY